MAERMDHHRVTGPDTGRRPDGDQSLHEQAERISVPNFDWVNEPISAISEAFAEFTTNHTDHHGAESADRPEHH